MISIGSIKRQLTNDEVVPVDQPVVKVGWSEILIKSNQNLLSPHPFSDSLILKSDEFTESERVGLLENESVKPRNERSQIAFLAFLPP